MSIEMMSPSHQRPRRRNAVHHLLVDRRANRRRVAVIPLERRLAPAVAQPPLRPAASSSAVVTPGATIAVSSVEHARHQLVDSRAAARAPPADRQTIIATAPLHAATAAGDRRRLVDRARPDPSRTWSGACAPLTDAERRPRAVVLDQRLRVALVDLQPLAAPPLVVVGRAAPACRRTLRARRHRPSTSTASALAPHVSQIRRVASRRTSSASGTTMSTTISGPRPRHDRVERLGLRHRPRKPVEHEPVRRVRLRQPLARRCRSSRRRPTSSPRSIIALACSAEPVPALHRLAQDVAGRDLRNPALAREPLRLRALARPGGPA